MALSLLHRLRRHTLRCSRQTAQGKQQERRKMRSGIRALRATYKGLPSNPVAGGTEISDVRLLRLNSWFSGTRLPSRRRTGKLASRTERVLVRPIVSGYRIQCNNDILKNLRGMAARFVVG